MIRFSVLTLLLCFLPLGGSLKPIALKTDSPPQELRADSSNSGGAKASFETYLKLALAGDEDGAVAYVTEVPVDFFRRSNNCTTLKYNDRATKPRSDNRLDGLILPAVGKSYRGFAQYGIERFFAHINLREYTDFEITKEQVMGNDGVLTIRFTDSFAGIAVPRTEILIFREVDGRSKLFLITTDDELEKTNKYFMRETCDNNDPSSL
jgi:hypothetical protein